MQQFVAGLILLLITGFVFLIPSDPNFIGPPVPETKTAPTFKTLDTSSDAQAMAALDLATVPQIHQPYMRYLWVEHDGAENLKVLTLALNYVSEATVLLKPTVIGKGPLMLARIDLRRYAPTDESLKRWLTTWEELQFDPALNLILTKDTLKLLDETSELPKVKKRVNIKKRVKTGTRKKVIDVPEYTHTDGKRYNQKEIDEDVTKEVDAFEYQEVQITKDLFKDVDVLRLPNPRTDPKILLALEQGTVSQAPVVSADYFLARAMRTIKDEGVFKAIYGGLYYEFAGIPLAKDKETDQDAFFETLGIGNIKGGLNADKLFTDLRGDQRVAVFRSKVTGKPRAIDFFHSLLSRDGSGAVSVTHDLKDKDVDLGQSPIMNLLKFKDAAREVIYERRNGMNGFVLFDGNGKRQDEVPFDVAKDHTIPAPHTARLEPAISCIRCHGKEDGWQPAENDVHKLLSQYGRLDVFGDITDINASIADTTDRIAGLYAGNINRTFLPRARDDYASAVLRAAGPWKAANQEAQATVVKVASAAISDVWARYYYDTVDAHRALLELGYDTVVKDSQSILGQLLPPELGAKQFGGIIPEDPRIGALKAGLAINRFEWDQVKAFASIRALKAQQKAKPAEKLAKDEKPSKDTTSKK
jgi:hypothetical protein